LYSKGLLAKYPHGGRGYLNHLPLRRFAGSQLGFESGQGEKWSRRIVEMSSSSESSSWLESWWPLLVILFGVIFVTALVTFHPVN
jgi:hypothetical protein